MRGTARVRRQAKPQPLTDRIVAKACGWTPMLKVTSWGQGRWQDPRGKIHPDLPMFTVSPTDIIREILDQGLHFSVRGPLMDDPPYTGQFHAEVKLKATALATFVANDDTPALALCRALMVRIKHVVHV